MKKGCKFLGVLVMGLMLLLGTSPAWAESDVGRNSDAVVHLDFQVRLPQILFLRIGSSGATVDTVGFDVKDVPENQSTVDGDNSPEVRVGAIVANNATVTLSADSSKEMVGSGTGTKMPFSTISCTGSGNFSSVSDLAFDGTASQQIWQGTGRGFRSGTFSYTYANSYDYPPDTYDGQVTYTLSSP